MTARNELEQQAKSLQTKLQLQTGIADSPISMSGWETFEHVQNVRVHNEVDMCNAPREIHPRDASRILFEL